VGLPQVDERVAKMLYDMNDRDRVKPIRGIFEGLRTSSRKE